MATGTLPYECGGAAFIASAILQEGKSALEERRPEKERHNNQEERNRKIMEITGRAREQSGTRGWQDVEREKKVASSLIFWG